MAEVLGLNAKLYYDVLGAANDDWTEMENVKDVTLTLTKSEADVTTRGSNGWRQTVGALKEATLDFEMVWDTDDDGFTAIQDAFINNTSIGMAAMDGDIDVVGTQGLVADFDVVSFTRTEPLEEVLKVAVSVKPTYSVTAPEWTTVAAGS